MDKTPEELVDNQYKSNKYHSSNAMDPVLIIKLDEGGIISYKKDTGEYIHTLNTETGFLRKLHDLGFEL
ncbi:MAG: hypothetical protein JW969_20135 [Spirochaetales bacterium]|nr:hypothetical protein [Spirochaetales bacterium]